MRVGDFEVNDFDVNLVAPWLATGQRFEGTARILHEPSSVHTSGTDERMPRLPGSIRALRDTGADWIQIDHTIAVSTPALRASRCFNEWQCRAFNNTQFRRASVGAPSVLTSSQYICMSRRDVCLLSFLVIRRERWVSK